MEPLEKGSLNILLNFHWCRPISVSSNIYSSSLSLGKQLQRAPASYWLQADNRSAHLQRGYTLLRRATKHEEAAGKLVALIACGCQDPKVQKELQMATVDGSHHLLPKFLFSECPGCEATATLWESSSLEGKQGLNQKSETISFWLHQ